MELKINVDERLSANLAHDVVLVGREKMRVTGLTPGNFLKVKCYDGTELVLRIEESPYNDIIVSRKTYRMIKEGQYKTDLGCDPEFVFVDALGRICKADSFLKKEGKIGSDGPLGELRPDPADHEDGVVENLRSLIQSLPGVVFKRFGHPSILTPEAHSEKGNLSMGFHIHLGAPKEITTYAAPRTREFVESFVAALDYFVGIPAILPEDNNIRRLKGENYGKPGDWRMSKRTIEYRTPGGFHLRHPDYARGIMGLALCVTESILGWAEDKSETWAKLDRISSFDTMAKEFQLPDKGSIRRVFDDEKKVRAFLLLPDIMTGLNRLSAYGKHKGSIEHFFKMVLDHYKVQPQLLSNW